MVKSILFVFLIFFAVIGLCEQIYIIKMFFYHPGIRQKNYTIVVLKSNHALRQLNFLWQKICWHGDEYAQCIIALTDNLNSEEITACNDFVFGKKIVLCDTNSLSQCHFLQGEEL